MHGILWKRKDERRKSLGTFSWLQRWRYGNSESRIISPLNRSHSVLVDIRQCRANADTDADHQDGLVNRQRTRQKAMKELTPSACEIFHAGSASTL